jgi:hypothetical protein
MVASSSCVSAMSRHLKQVGEGQQPPGQPLLNRVKYARHLHLHTPYEQQVRVAANGGRERLEIPQRLSEQPASMRLRDTAKLDDGIAWHRADIRQRQRANQAFASGHSNIQCLAGIEPATSETIRSRESKRFRAVRGHETISASAQA